MDYETEYKNLDFERKIKLELMLQSDPVKIRHILIDCIDKQSAIYAIDIMIKIAKELVDGKINRP